MDIHSVNPLMKVYINGITLNNGKRNKLLPATSFYVTAVEENGEVIFSTELAFRGIKGSALAAEFEALYYLLSPANSFKRYSVISTNSKIIPRWVKEGKEIKETGISEFEFAIINHENKGEIIFEEHNLAKKHNIKIYGENGLPIPTRGGGKKKVLPAEELTLLPFLQL